MDFVLDYRSLDGIRLVGFAYSDWVGIVPDRKSTFKSCFSLGLTVVSWFSQKQNSIALSSVEDEYMESNQANCEALWLRKLLVNLFG